MALRQPDVRYDRIFFLRVHAGTHSKLPAHFTMQASVGGSKYAMRTNQLTRGEKRRVMYVENKDGQIDGTQARIGWVTFSQSGRTVYYRGRSLKRAKGGGISGNFFDVANGQEYWISGIKKNGSNIHWAERISVLIDDDAHKEYERIRSKR